MNRLILSLRQNWKRSTVIAFALALHLFPIPLVAQQPTSSSTSVTGLLHSRKIAIGEKGIFAILVNNGTLSEIPKAIKADGLTIEYQGQNTNLSVVNNSAGQSIRTNQTQYYFKVSGETEGTFTIPPLTLDVRSKAYTTQAAELIIFKRKAGDLTLDASKPYFLRLTSPKTSIYVNEIVPLELTAFVRGRNSIDDIDPPSLKNEDMIIKPFQRNLTQENLTLDGYDFSVVKIQGSAFPLQSGEQVLQQASLNCRFIDRSARSGGGFRSFFANLQSRTLQSNSLTFSVKPLPKEGKPATFSGAVGQFDMEIKASPRKLQIGDPISIDITIEGVGNFDRLAAPTFLIKNPDKWRTYEARKIIDPNEQSDGVVSGKCNFSQIVIPLSETSELPSFEISYFNPETEQYESRQSLPIPLDISADTRAAPTAGATGVNGQSSGVTSFASPPVPNFNDILYIMKGAPHFRSIQASLHHRPLFWFIQLIPLILLSWILGIALIRFAKSRGFGAEKKESHADYEQLHSQVKGSASARAGYYKKIEECLTAWQQQTKQPLNSQPNTIAVGYNALNSRCQWILYGAPATDRNAPPTDRETTEANQILSQLSQHLR